MRELGKSNEEYVKISFDSRSPVGRNGGGGQVYETDKNGE
jgi:hypothetical protein